MVITRESIFKAIKNEVPDKIRNVAADVIFFLSDLGYDPLKYIDKLNSVECLLYASDEENFVNPKIEYICDGENRYVTNINFVTQEGFFHTIVDADKEGNVYICKEVLAFNESVCNETVNKAYKTTIIHELFHLFSATPLIEEEKRYCLKRGVLETVINKNETLAYREEIGMNEINEAMTEVISYYIYKKIYDKSFFIETKIVDGVIMPRPNSYYLIIPAMRYINFLVTEDIEPLYMLDCYLNNDFTSYMNLVNKRLAINKKELTKLFFKLVEYTLKFLLEEDEILVDKFKKEIAIPFKGMLKHAKGLNLKEAEAYAKVLFDFPISSIILEELQEYFAEKN